MLEIKYETDVTTTATVDYEYYEYVSWNGGDYSVTFVEDSNGDYEYRYYYYKYVGKGKGSYRATDPTTSGNGRNYVKKIDRITESTTTTVTKTININLANITKDKLWDAGNRYLYNLVYSNDAIGTQVTVMNWEGDKGGDVTFE